jgi:hypothetical protein
MLMSNMYQHRYVRGLVSCECGSQWNWLADACSSLYPMPEPVAPALYFDTVTDDGAFFECRKGHAFCVRH